MLFSYDEDEELEGFIPCIRDERIKTKHRIHGYISALIVKAEQSKFSPPALSFKKKLRLTPKLALWLMVQTMPKL
jgi:hypothetical protein